MRYRVNTPNVIQENIDGEVIIIHLSSGCYFSLEGIAADIWDGIVKGMDEGQIVEATSLGCEGDPQQIEQAVRQFLVELGEEELIVGDDGEGVVASREPRARSLPQRPAFLPPTLHKYRDMQELLLIDPIHEVAATGWPAKKKDPSE